MKHLTPWRLTILIVFVLSTLYWAIESTYKYTVNHTLISDIAIKNASSHTDRLVEDIRKSLFPLASEAKKFAIKEWNKDSLEKELENVLIQNPRIFGVGAAFEPYLFDPDMRLYAPYYTRTEQSIDLVDIADYSDYTKEAWYSGAISHQAQWNKLRKGSTSSEQLIEFTSPILHEGKPVGLVFINYTLSALQKRLKLADLGENGYGFIIDRNGRLIDHPTIDKAYVGEKLVDIPEFQSAEISRAVKDIQQNRKGKVDSISNITNKASWLYYTPVPDTSLAVLTVFEKPLLLPNSLNQVRQFTQLMVAWNVFFIVFVFFILSLLKTRGLNSYWGAVALVSILMLSSIATLWYVTLQGKYQQETHETLLENNQWTDKSKQEESKNSWGSRKIIPIESHVQLDNFQRHNTEASLQQSDDPPRYVPTGVFVQSIEFTSANNVVMTGYIWQHYLKDYHNNLSREIVIPEAESVEFKEAYKKTDGNKELIGWNFRVTLRQNFDYTHYPLDKQSVWLRLWHKDFDKNVVLTPDLNSYEQLNSEWLPGIEKDFVLSGWDLERSFFNYHYNSYNTNFGIDNYVGQTRFPELYFNIGVKRDFFDPFVSQLTPMFVVLLMLFAILVTSSKDEKRNSLLGFNTSGVLASSSALFFVALVSHIDLRSSLEAKEIVYLENIYFIIYLSLLVVSVNSILFSWGIHFPSVNGISLAQHRDNLLPKLLFWPMVTGQLFVLTLFDLYPWK